MIAGLLLIVTVCAVAAAAIFGADPLWLLGTVVVLALLVWLVAGLNDAAPTHRRHPIPALPPAPPQLPPSDAQYGTAWARPVPPHRHRRHR